MSGRDFAELYFLLLSRFLGRRSLFTLDRSGTEMCLDGREGIFVLGRCRVLGGMEL